MYGVIRTGYTMYGVIRKQKSEVLFFKNEIFEKRKTIFCESFGNVVRKIVPGA